MLLSMAITSMQLDSALRDELAELAEKDYNGVPLGEAVRRLIREHKVNQAVEAYERLRADPVEWASYRTELDEWDATSADGLPASGGYPDT